jgi:hypothetical protein
MATATTSLLTMTLSSVKVPHRRVTAGAGQLPSAVGRVSMASTTAAWQLRHADSVMARFRVPIWIGSWNAPVVK